jgi:hypothetical protein
MGPRGPTGATGPAGNGILLTYAASLMPEAEIGTQSIITANAYGLSIHHNTALPVRSGDALVEEATEKNNVVYNKITDNEVEVRIQLHSVNSSALATPEVTNAMSLTQKETSSESGIPETIEHISVAQETTDTASPASDYTANHTIHLQNTLQSLTYGTLLPFDAVLTDYHILFYQPNDTQQIPSTESTPEPAFYGAVAVASKGETAYEILSDTFAEAVPVGERLWEVSQQGLHLTIPRNKSILLVAGGYDEKKMNLVNTEVFVNGSLALFKLPPSIE